MAKKQQTKKVEEPEKTLEIQNVTVNENPEEGTATVDITATVVDSIDKVETVEIGRAHV